MSNSYKNLMVWERSVDMVIKIYEFVKKFPKEETYSLSDQIRRAAVSVPSNISEGYSRGYTQNCLQFLSIARGSVAEIETQILIAYKLQYISEEDYTYVIQEYSEIGKMINGLIRNLEEKKSS